MSGYTVTDNRGANKIKLPTPRNVDLLHTLVKLNLGSGSQPEDGYINVDIADIPGVDVVADLDRDPWPFTDECASEIRAWDIFEHVEDPLLFMREAHRVLAPTGLISVHTSYWKTENSYTDPTHKRFCTEHTFDYWIRGTEFHGRYGAAYGGHAHPFDRVAIALHGQELYVVLQRV